MSAAASDKLFLQLAKEIKAGRTHQIVDLAPKAGNLDRSFNHNSMTPILGVLASGDEVALNALLDAGADPNFATKRLVSPLSFVVGRKHDVKMMRILVERGADIELISGGRNSSPLMQAARVNALDALRFLIECGANVNQRNSDNDTALHHAAFENRLEAARILLENGAKPDARDSSGMKPLDDFAHHKSSEAFILFMEYGTDLEKVRVPNVNGGPLAVSGVEFCERHGLDQALAYWAALKLKRTAPEGLAPETPRPARRV